MVENYFRVKRLKRVFCLQIDLRTGSTMNEKLNTSQGELKQPRTFLIFNPSSLHYISNYN